MYAPFFGLRQEPFSIAPDPRYLFMTDRHREALAHLMHGLACGGGIVLLTGEIGTGKTTVCRCFLEQVPARCNVAYIFNPKLSAVELLESVCEEFRVPLPPAQGAPRSIKDCLDPLNAFLLQAHAQGRDNLLVIDEAQNLAPEVLEQLRLLTNLETPARKLLQVILIGQPELRAMVARPELEQLAQRVVARFHLTPLTLRETAHYVQHRLEVAGLSQMLPFDRTALRRIWLRARGVPRRINLLCDRALLGAYARSTGRVSVAMVDQAAREVFGAGPAGWRGRPRSWRWWAGAALSLMLLAGAGRWWVLGPGGTAGVGEPGPALAGLEGLRPVALAGGGAGRAATGPVGAAEVSRLASAPRPHEGALAASALLLHDPGQAWRELAREWHIELPPRGDPCVAAAAEQLQCFQQTTSLALIRQLGRPGILTLDRDSGQPAYALVVGLGEDSITLRAGGVEQTVTLRALAARWQGEFATLWRTPPGYTGRRVELERGTVVTWASNQLARGEPVGRSTELVTQEEALQGRLRAFQRAHGLPASGQLNAMTLMQLNRAAGIDEPRLRTQS